jgi:ribosome-associated translation inhibitor RaiA
MLIPIQISLYGVAPSNALLHCVRDKATKLERLYDRIACCRVVLSLDARPDRPGKQFSAHIAVKLPGGEIAVTHEHDQNVQVALRDAFAAARRKLEDHLREKRAPSATSTPERSSLPAYCA